MTNLFVRFESSKEEARANVRAARKSTIMPTAFDAEFMVADGRRDALDAAMDAYLTLGDPETWFTVYSGSQIGKWSGKGKIYFVPDGVRMCENKAGIHLHRNRGQTSEKAVSEPVAPSDVYEPQIEVAKPRKQRKVTLDTSEPIPVVVVSSYQGQQPLITQNFLNQAGAPVAIEQPLTAEEIAEQKRGYKRVHPIRKWAIVAMVAGLAVLAMHVYDIAANAPFAGAASSFLNSAPGQGQSYAPQSYTAVSKPIKQAVASVEHAAANVAAVVKRIVAPSLYAPTLTKLSEGSARVVYTAPAVAGATQYESAYRIVGGSGYNYSYTLANGGPFYGVVNSLMPDNNYQFWVRAVWHSGSRARYGPWSAPLDVRTYPTWTAITNEVDASVVQVSAFNYTSFFVGHYNVGSGFFVSGGYIVTNWHVVRPVHYQYWYRQNGGEWHSASLVAYSRSSDLALLKPDAPAHALGLPGAQNNPPHNGQPVEDVGFPLGQSSQVNAPPGHITAMNQTMNVSTVGTLYNMIQAKVDTYEGCSGSPVFNHWGYIIGVLENGPSYKNFTPQALYATDGIVSLTTLAQFLDSARSQLGLNQNFFKTY